MITFLLLVKCMYAAPVMDTRIIGGDDIHISEYPATVSLNVYRSTHICGGTIIGSRWVLTAAHCIDPSNKPNFYSINLNSTFIGDNSLIDYIIKDYIIHPDYNEYDITSDIAILELERDISERVKKTVISINEPDVGESAHTIGWGVIGYFEGDGFLPEHLQYTTGVIMSTYHCEKFVRRPGVVCFDPREGSTTCSGDSGTGLYNDDDILIGVTSFGYSNRNTGECMEEAPSGFARTDHFIDFICNYTDSSVEYTGGSCEDPPPKREKPSPQFIIFGAVVGVVVLGVSLSVIFGYCFQRRTRELNS
ncbi:putative serine protease [Emiliania huxleyi virus 18]|nr:putative serine protease [Emiliania huxleyi virus 18]AHA55290.1 putative serine protease [Emiliania huxleyi virus 156]